jgi:fibronectin type 3 domain-containing protein
LAYRENRLLTRAAQFQVLAAAVFLVLSGCGYVGPVLPPSPQLPTAVTDLHAIERGDQIVITFSTPIRTTDSLSIKRFTEIDLRIGATHTPFDFNQWAAGAQQYSLTPPPPNDRDNPQAVPMTKSIPASDWIGKHVVIAVRTAVRKTDHYSSWSNRAILNVIKPLEPPVVKAEATAQGVLVSWEKQVSGAQYTVYRQGPGEPQPVQIGTSDHPDYLDKTAQYDTQYTYTAIATKGSAESLTSNACEITPVDKFAPSVPASITALAGPDSIEVSWQRSPESDLKGYYVYRSVNGGPFERQGGLVSVPTFSDRHVEHGKTYRYEVSAVDQKNNESGKSAAAQTTF